MRSFIYALPMLALISAPALAQPKWNVGTPVKLDQTFKVVAKAEFPRDCEGVFSLTLGSSQALYTHTENRSVNGVPFTITTKRYQYNDQVCLTTDLSDLMAKIPAIVASANLPNNSCAKYVGPSPVIAVYNSSLAPVPNFPNLNFSMNGKMTPWYCKPGLPVVSTSWVKNKFGIPVPKTSVSPGPDIKTVGIVEPFSENITFRLDPSGANGVAPAHLGSALPFFSIVVSEVDLGWLIKDALSQAVPSFNHPTAPLVHREGQQYDGAVSRIWGTI